jgi:hypothetical protein
MRRALWLGIAAVLLTRPPAVSAHVRLTAGDIHLTVGWGDEPAFSGFKNTADVDVADAAGAPIADLGGGSLTVEITFGEERVSLPMTPVRDRPGRFRALLVPTRAGTYTFHITGTVKGQPIDVSTTCSDTTFGCIRDAASVQFPVKDPSAGQLAERVSRAVPRAERAADAAGSARLVGFAAIAVAVAALVAAVRKRR